MGFIDHKTKSPIVNLGVIELVSQLRSGSVTAIDVVDAYAYMIEHDHCNAVPAVSRVIESAREAAKAADNNLRSGKMRKLEGVPFLSKPLFCVKGVHTDACSDMLRGFVSPYDAAMIEALKDEGAIMMGSANMDEFAMGSTTKTSCHGPTYNPWRDDRTPDKLLMPGGSSGGSAAAVACSMAPFILGSDTGGSVRQPAAMCGVVGMKPTYGLCSRFGMIAFASSLDQAGVLSRSVADAAYVMGIMAGYDGRDATSVNISIPDYNAMITQDVRGVRIGIPREYRGPGLSQEVDDAWRMASNMLKDRGAQIVDVSLPSVNYSIPTYYIIVCSEASSNLARYDGIRYGATESIDGKISIDDYYHEVRSKYFGNEVKRRIVLGAYCLKQSRDGMGLYERARMVRALIYKEFAAAFEKVDVILCPTATGSAYPLDAVMDQVSVYYNDIFTAPVNLCGCPGISVPIGLNSNGLPLGMQIMGKRFDEGMVFNVASTLENASGFKLPEPKLI